MLAGFESPTAGEIVLDGRPINATPPHKRDIGMVFQNYALFPHMTVARERRLSADGAQGREGRAWRRRVDRGARHGPAATAWPSGCPAQLSGGQQQRVALARALVFEPAAGADGRAAGRARQAAARAACSSRSSDLHRQLGVTFVYVTHDQGEALTMSDRVAVFNDGAHPAARPRRPDCTSARPTLRRRLHRREQRLHGTMAACDGGIATSTTTADRCGPWPSTRVISARRSPCRCGRSGWCWAEAAAAARTQFAGRDRGADLPRRPYPRCGCACSDMTISSSRCRTGAGHAACARATR